MSAHVQVVRPRIDLSRYELTIDRRRAKLERQPMELLILFVRRHGQLVTRDEIIEQLWGKDVFVDADRSINTAVRKIRSALKDDSAHPHYLETVVGKGYRFIGEVDIVDISPAPQTSLKSVEGELARPVEKRRIWQLWWGLAALVAIVSAAIWIRIDRHTDPFQPPIRSIAVLPLGNLSGDPSQDYFSEGLTEELTTDLGMIRSLKVISRTSAQKYRTSNKSAPQIARELKVDAIVEGSALRAGNKVRISIQLIDAVHDRHLWAESYERDVSDVLAVQSTVAIEIARQIRIRLTSTEQQRLERHEPVHPEAYDAYLRGRYSQTRQSGESLKNGLAAFEDAIHLDPTYAPAFAGLSDTYSLLANYGVLAPSEAFPQAIAAAKKSLELDPLLADAHTAAAYPEHHYTWEWAAAEREYRYAITLNPSYPTAHLRYAEYLSSTGRHDEAIAEMQRALDLDPLSVVYTSNLGRFLYHARRYDQAIEVLRKTLSLDPGRTYAKMYLAMCYVEKRLFAQAGDQYQQILDASGGRPGPGVAYFYAKAGNSAKANQIVKRLRTVANDSDWFFLAGVYAALDNKNDAFFCLDQAYRKHDFFLVFLKVHPFMDPLRSDPRFLALAKGMGLEELGR